MEKIDLGKGEWRLREVGMEDWIPVDIPGEVHLALMQQGIIPDPFAADNELSVQWVAEKDWEFEGLVHVSELFLNQEKIWIRFEGLDTLADVSLNGHLLGKTDNAFRSYSWEVKPFLNEGQNHIRIIFHSPVTYVDDQQKKKPLASPEQSIPGGPHLRKAPCQWGWDWGPMLPPIGIWKDAFLEGYSQAKFDSVHIRQEHLFDGTVDVKAAAQIEHWQAGNLQLCMTLCDPDGHTFATTCKVLDGRSLATIEIPEPHLW